jgi:hypothetical protein
MKSHNDVTHCFLQYDTVAGLTFTVVAVARMVLTTDSGQAHYSAANNWQGWMGLTVTNTLAWCDTEFLMSIRGFKAEVPFCHEHLYSGLCVLTNKMHLTIRLVIGYLKGHSYDSLTMVVKSFVNIFPCSQENSDNIPCSCFFKYWLCFFLSVHWSTWWLNP